MGYQLHWEQGLFLKQHHLQLAQRQSLDTWAAEHFLTWPFPYGIVRAELNTNALQGDEVCFTRLHVVTRQGIEINYNPEELAEVKPPPLLVTGLFSGTRLPIEVHLLVPRRQEGMGLAPEREGEHFYKTFAVSCRDENSAEDPLDITMHAVDARLVLKDPLLEKRGDVESFPLIRILRKTSGDIAWELIGPCLVYTASTVIHGYLQTIASRVENARKELSTRIRQERRQNPDLTKSIQFEQMMRLRVLNRFAARLPLLARVSLPTYLVYLELREFLAELAALDPMDDRFPDGLYEHDSPFAVLEQMQRSILRLLGEKEKKQFIPVKFVRLPDTANGHVFRADFAPEHFGYPVESYYLSIKSAADSRAAVTKVATDPRSFKLVARSRERDGRNGVDLSPADKPPILPIMLETFYYKLERDHVSWQAIADDRKASIVIPNMEDGRDYEITMYLMTPDGSLPSEEE